MIDDNLEDIAAVNIQHKKTESGRAYGEPICELWIDLPSGERLFFSDVGLSEWNTDAQNDEWITETKSRIIAGLRELMSVHQ